MKYMPLNALSVDVEDAISLAMRNFFGKDMDPTFRVVENTKRLLDLFGEYNTKATFFVLGEVAKTYPELIRKIADQGHELGIHGNSHVPYHKLSKKKVMHEIIDSKHIVEDVSGVEVRGHRAPEFSINENNSWVLEVLLDAGIKYDSSIFPAKLNRYGWSGFNNDIDWVSLPNGQKIIEFPLSTISLCGRKIPVCGGGYLRVLPYSITNYATKSIQRSRPANVYLHPYEIDQPPFQDFYMDEVIKSSIRYKMKLRGYWFNRSSVMPKLKTLLNSFEFDTHENIINKVLSITL